MNSNMTIHPSDLADRLVLRVDELEEKRAKVKLSKAG